MRPLAAGRRSAAPSAARPAPVRVRSRFAARSAVAAGPVAPAARAAGARWPGPLHCFGAGWRGRPCRFRRSSSALPASGWDLRCRRCGPGGSRNRCSRRPACGGRRIWRCSRRARMSSRPWLRPSRRHRRIPRNRPGRASTIGPGHATASAEKSCCGNEKRRTTRCNDDRHSTRAFLTRLNSD